MRRRFAALETHQLLHRGRTLAMAATALALLVSLLSVVDLITTATSVRDRGSQAILENASARVGVERAYAEAVRSLGSQESKLTGPGDRYLSQLEIASQGLSRAAETNAAGAQGSQTVQVTTGLLSAFGGSIGQADAHLRADNRVLGLTDLSYASRLLHQPSGLLDQMNVFAGEQRDAVRNEVDLDVVRVLELVVWLLATVVALGVLVALQAEMTRRFRRTVNLPLAVGTIAVVASLLGIVAWLNSFSTTHGLVDRVDAHAAAVADQVRFSDTHGEAGLSTLLSGLCGQRCGDTVAKQATPSADELAGTQTDAEIIQEARAVNTQAGDAVSSAVTLLWIPGALLLAEGLIYLGVQSRISDYRFARP